MLLKTENGGNRVVLRLKQAIHRMVRGYVVATRRSRESSQIEGVNIRRLIYKV